MVGTRSTIYESIRPVDEGISRATEDTSSDGHATQLNAMRTLQPIFTFVTVPRVTMTKREDLVEWLQLRSENEENIRERCKDGKEDISSLMRSVKNSFDEALLDTLCEVRWVWTSATSQTSFS